ncbi:hypothetical protein Ancab_039880 [Ancistrocladus abbreviatus]
MVGASIRVGVVYAIHEMTAFSPSRLNDKFGVDDVSGKTFDSELPNFCVSSGSDADDENIDKTICDDVATIVGPLLLVPLQKDVDMVVKEMPEGDSDEFNSIHGSHEDEGDIYSEFNPRINFSIPIVFKVGMEFSTNDVFRQALRKHAIEKGYDYYYLHNNSKWVLYIVFESVIVV